MFFRTALSMSLILATTAAEPTTLCDRVLNATDTLNRYFSPKDGRWDGLWWNSGVMMNTIGNVAQTCPDFKPAAIEMFSTIYDAAKASNGGNFLDAYYDDEGWWATGWLKAYDVAGEAKYLSAAVDIYNDLLTGTDKICDGGIFWSKTIQYPATIANELLLAVSSNLASRIPSNRTYLDSAQTQLDWFLTSGLLNTTTNVISDGLDINTCKPVGETWTYNQGVILGALIEMSKLTANTTYLPLASKIAHAAITHFAAPNNGILTEPGSIPAHPVVGSHDYGDGEQFKGIFARNLMYLELAAHDDAFVEFLTKNADSIWNNNRQPDGELGALWQGPVIGLSPASQGSALDCLVAAATVEEVDVDACESDGGGASSTSTASGSSGPAERVSSRSGMVTITVSTIAGAVARTSSPKSEFTTLIRPTTTSLGPIATAVVVVTTTVTNG